MADASKKRKMSKADKEKLKREEQERKAQEEAFLDESSNAKDIKADDKAARLRLSEEGKKLKKVEAALAIERAKQENLERKQRREDLTELEQILEANRQKLLEENKSRRVQAKWARYMRCDGSPDPVNQGEINTYINLCLEDKTRNDAESVLKDTNLSLQLIDELQFILSDTPPEELSEKTKSLYRETTTEMENLISCKLDYAALQLLCDATKLANCETGNLQHIIQNDQISLCVWGNLMKNPRIRNFEFPGLHYTFDIPRVLGLSDCAVCLLVTKFDHLSPSSKSMIPRRKKKEEEVVEQKIELEQQISVQKTEEEQEKEKEETEEEKVEEKEETELDLMAALKDPEGTEEEPKEEDEENEAYEEDYNYPPTPEVPEWEDFEEDDDIVDLRANDILGGVYKLTLLQMPPQPKTVGSWTITQMVDPPELHRIDYVAEPPVPNAEGVKDKENKDKKDDKTPIQISTLLPPDVMFLEEPQVARWDFKKKMWSTDGFSDFDFNEEARTFSFKTLQFGTMCFLQDSHINMPFQSWEIRPHKVNSALFTIIAAIVEIEIEIKDALCCLSQPHDKPELNSIRNKWVTPAELILMLKRAGVNVFPNEDSSKYVNIHTKDPYTEQSVYHQMALTSSTMAYSWSKWNGKTEVDQIVFQGAEALEDEPLLEEDWSVFLATKYRVSKLKMTEFDDSFTADTSSATQKSSLDSLMTKKSGKSPKIGTDSKSTRSKSPKSPKSGVPGIKAVEESKGLTLFKKTFDLNESRVFKSNLYHLMPDIASDKGVQRVKNTSHQFIDCVHQLLKATQVLTYA